MTKPWMHVPVVKDQVYAREQAGSTDSDLASFRRLTGSNRTDELDEATFQRYQKLAGWLYFQNPLARRLCDVPTDIVLGAGISIDTTLKKRNADGKKVKTLLDRFIENPINKLEIMLPEYFTVLNAVKGELFLPTFVNEHNGDVAISYLDHSKVTEVIWESGNPLQAKAVIQEAPSPGEDRIWWNVIQASQKKDEAMFPPHPNLATAKNSADPEKDPIKVPGDKINWDKKDYTYAGEIFYFNANKLGSGRGRSALEPVLDWLHAYDGFLFSDLRNAALQASFVWDVKMTGASDTDMKSKREELKKSPPRPGEILIHNELEEWDAVSPNLNAASHTELGVQVKKVIGLGLGYPPHLVGAEDQTGRTTSTSSDIPFLRRMEQKQKLLLYLVKTLIDYMLDQKRHAQVLAVMRPYPYRIMLPNLTAGEIVALAESLANITNSVIEAKNEGVTSMEEARRIWYEYGVQEKNIPENIDADIDAERKKGVLRDPVELEKEGLENKSNGVGGGRVLRAKTGQGGPRASQRGET